MYEILKKQFTELTIGIDNFIANAANLSSLLFESLKDLNWVGFYFLDKGRLILGPFQGKPACMEIEIGKGVCGTAIEKKKIILVDDVYEFSGHIACDSASKSEIVLPVEKDGKLYGVLDIDSPIKARFKLKDLKGLQELLEILIKKSDLISLSSYYEN